MFIEIHVETQGQAIRKHARETTTFSAAGLLSNAAVGELECPFTIQLSPFFRMMLICKEPKHEQQLMLIVYLRSRSITAMDDNLFFNCVHHHAYPMIVIHENRKKQLVMTEHVHVMCELVGSFLARVMHIIPATFQQHGEKNGLKK